MQENRLQGAFDDIREKAERAIQLDKEEVKSSVDKFNRRKHIFIYNKDLSKGYFLRIDPNRIDEVARRLHTFKFKEPRITAAEDSEEEEKEKRAFDEKFFHKRYRSEQNQFKPKTRSKLFERLKSEAASKNR